MNELLRLKVPTAQNESCDMKVSQNKNESTEKKVLSLLNESVGNESIGTKERVADIEFVGRESVSSKANESMTITAGETK